MYVLTFHEFEHKGGRRYRRNSQMAILFETMEEAEKRVAALKQQAVVSREDQMYGLNPASYEWAIYNLRYVGSGEYAIKSGTTEPFVKEP